MRIVVGCYGAFSSAITLPSIAMADAPSARITYLVIEITKLSGLLGIAAGLGGH